MIAAIPGNYSHLSPVVWTIFTVVIVLIALGGGYLLMRRITAEGVGTERWIDEDDEPATDVWKGFGPAEKSYERHPVTEAKPMSVFDWLSRQQ